MRTLVKTAFNVDAAESFVTSVRTGDPYFIFTSRPGPELTVVPTPLDSQNEEQALFDDMLFGKRVNLDDVELCARRYDWQLGKVYAMYDDIADLSSEEFYVVTQDGVNLKVYKCLFNNNGGPSLAEPTSTSLFPFETMEDGYIWKYMFTVDSFFSSKFANSTKIPIIANTEVSNAAVSGAVDIVKVENGGISYNNYTTGNFGSQQNIRVNGNSLEYALDGNASIVDNFYRNCLIRIVSGTVTNGQTRLITGYRIEDGRRIITIDEPFEITPLATDQYEINPNVFITDTGGSFTTECIARAIIDPTAANTISSVEILNPGADYRNAIAEVRPDPSVDVDLAAQLRPIMPPEGGHGSNPAQELDAYFVGISASFTGNSEPFIAENVFQSYGLLKNPLYANCQLSIDVATLNGNFIEGEDIYRYRPIKLADTVDSYANGTTLSSNAEFTQSLRNGDCVLILTPTDHYFTDIQVISDTELRTVVLPEADLLGAELFLTPKEYFAKCTAVSANNLSLTNVRPVGLGISQNIFGATSQAFTKTQVGTDYITSFGRNIAQFNDFNQIIRLEGVRTTQDEFIPNETITQVQEDGTVATAIVHSYVQGENSQLDSLYVTGEINTLTTGTLTTNRADTLQTTFEVSNKYSGELVRDIGDILYVENVDPITRQPEQVEQIKLYLEF